MKHKTLLMLVGSIGVSLASCEPGIPAPGNMTEGRISGELIFWMPSSFMVSSMELIGRGLNGTALNGQTMDDVQVASVSLDRVVLRDGKVRDLKLAGSRFSGPGVGSSPTGIRDVVGAIFTARLEDGNPLMLRIEDIVLSRDEGGEYFRYDVSYATREGWAPLCGVDDAGIPHLAVPLNGVWDLRAGVPGGGSWSDDPGTFTMACDGFVLSKCVAMGYPPWAEGRICSDSRPGRSGCVKTTLAAHHQACSRMLRADYCGDGSSNTLDGTWVNAYDGIGIRVDSEDWSIEAEWTPDGARCIDLVRTPQIDSIPCLNQRIDADCGDPLRFEAGTFIMSEIDAE
jgi:hypothetical protein